MLITNMSKTNTDVKKMKKFYRIINIGSLKNDSYGNVQFVKPELELFNEEKYYKSSDAKHWVLGPNVVALDARDASGISASDKTQYTTLKCLAQETQTPESIAF